MNEWIVTTGNTIALRTMDESVARAKAEELASAGSEALLCVVEAKCVPASAAPVWTP